MKKLNLVLGMMLAGAGGMAVADSLFINATGQVGVGTNTPVASMQVVGAANTVGPGNAVIKLENPGSLAFQLDDTTNNAGGNSFWNFSTVDQDNAFRISRSGTGGTELELTAAGDLMVRGDIVSGGNTIVPDYVFASDYKLMPLGEVEKFIEENSHLPNVPSAAEYKSAGGVNVSELQMKLLEKVEELTLYTLQQQKTIDALQAKVGAMSQK